MSILWNVDRALDLLVERTGPEPSDRRTKDNISKRDLEMLISHLEAIQAQIGMIGVYLTGRFAK